MSLQITTKPVARRRLWATADGRRFIAGAVVLAVILFGQSIYGMATASGRLDPSLRNATSPSNVVVVLDFMPDRFHNERAAQYGTFAGRDWVLEIPTTWVRFRTWRGFHESSRSSDVAPSCPYDAR